MSTKDFLNIGVETNKGSALHSLKDEGAAGVFDSALFTMTGVMVDQEEFVLGDDTYEFNVILTDTGAEATAEVTAGDTAFTFDVAPTIALVPGAVIRMEVEFMIVLDYNPNGPSVNVIRGAFGSVDATHSIANSDTFQAAQLPEAGNLPVPLSAVAAATADGQLIGALNFWAEGYRKGLGGGTGVNVKSNLPVLAVQGASTSVVIGVEANGGVPDSSDGLDSVTVNFTDGGAGEDFMEATDGVDFVDLGIKDGDTITIGSAVANDGAFVVLGVEPRTVDAQGDEVDPSKISVATGSWTDEAQADAITISQATAQTNATLSAFAGGVEAASQKFSKVVHKVTAADVSADQVEFFAPFDVDEAFAIVMDATGVQLIWDGTVSVVGGRLVTFLNGGSVDPEAGDTIVMTFYAA